MLEVLAAAVAFPTVVFTALLAISLGYWLFVLVGAIDGGGGEAEGAAKGAMEGAVKGALEGAANGAVEGAAKGAVEGAADAAHGHGEGGVLATLLLAIGFQRAPATLLLSLFSLFGWIASTLLSLWVGPAAGWAPRALVLAAASVVGLIGTAVASRPVAPLFAVRGARRHAELVGQIAVVSTGRVDATFGQAKLETGGAELILDVRCDGGRLERGDRVLVVGWSATAQAFDVEPLDPASVRPLRVGEPGAEQDPDPPGQGLEAPPVDEARRRA